MPDIFINYRTGDVEHAAAAIERDLSHRFGSDRVFYAGKTILGGENFRTALLRNARTCAVLLALIGPDWLTVNDEGLVSLFDPEDWVRQEIIEAFSAGARVIPVLVGKRTERLKPVVLPKELRPLGDCQSVPYDHRNAERDLGHLSELISAVVPSLVDRTATARPGEPAPATGGPSINNVNHSGIQNSPAGRDIFQGRDRISVRDSGVGYMAGGSIGTVVNGSNAPVHTGSGNQYGTAGPVRRVLDTGDDEA
ncbi:MAG TPA: TIR domain-containing protein [Actinocrinis sp.]|nr:TIR domain-containing protein [Actinocrinis sp.]